MFSKFSRIGAEPVKWQFTVHIAKLSLPSLKTASVVLSRGDSKVSTPYTEPSKGYFTFPEPLTLTCTLYRKRDKGGNGVYLPKEGEVRVMEKGKAKEAGVVAIDFSDYVSESRAEVESNDNNWRIEKAADKYNNFMIVNITAKRLGPGGAEEAGGGGAAEATARKEEVKEADGEEEEEEDEAEKEDRDWKKRNTLPASKAKPTDAKKNKWQDEEEEDEEEEDAHNDEDEEDEPLEDEDDSPPKRKPAPSTAAAAAKSKSSKPTHDDDDNDDEEWSEDEDDIIKRLKGLKADGKLAPGAVKSGVSASGAGKGGGKVEEKKVVVAVKGKVAGVKKDRSQMTAKELLFADSDEEEEEKDEEEAEEVKPKRAAPGKSSAAAASIKSPAGKETAKEDKGKAGSKAASSSATSRPAQSIPNWEVVIPTASSTSSPRTNTLPARTAAAATPPAQPIPANRLFSCTLPEALTVYPTSLKSPPPVPYILTFLLQQLEKSTALTTPSLFKQYVDPTHTTALRTQLEGGGWKLRGPYAEDAHVLGGVLKGWVSGLQDGLVGEALVGEVLEVGKMEGEEDDDVKAAVKKVANRLSPLHRATLATLLQFLHTMTLPLNTRKNGMKAESLASAWGAAIVRMKADPKKSAYDQFQDKANVNRFVQFSIKHIDALKAATGGGGAASAGMAAGRAVVHVEEEEEGAEEEAGDEEDDVLKEEEEEEDAGGKGESDEEVTGLKFHADHEEEDEEEEPKPKGKGSKPLTARERLEQEKQEREKQKAEKERAEKARIEKEKADKERLDKEKADKLKAEKEKAERDRLERERKEKEERDRKEKERKEKEEKERKEKERKEREEREKREREEKERKDKEKHSAGKKGSAAVAAFKPSNVFGDSDDEGEQVHDDEEEEEEEQHEEDEEPEKEEEVKTIQPKARSELRSPSPATVTVGTTSTTSNKADRELISRLQAELESLRKQLTDTQAKSSTRPTSSSGDDVSELKTKLVAALKEKDAALKDKREADKKLSALEGEREQQKKMVEKLQKMLVAKGKIDAAQLSELTEAKGRGSPAPPPPPPAAGGGVGGGKLSEHLSVMQLKYDSMVEEMEQKLTNEKQIRKQLKQQLEQLTEENSNLRQRSMHFDQLVQTNPATATTLTSPTAASPQQGGKKTKDELLAIVAQQYERIAFLEHTMRENENMMRQAKSAWADTARILEAEMEGKEDELRRMRDGYEAAVGGKGVEWVGEEEWRKRVERLKREKERLERERKEMEDEVRGKRVELQEAMKTIVQLEDDTRLLKEELTRTGIALKTIAEDNFELKEWMRLHSKGKKG